MPINTFPINTRTPVKADVGLDQVDNTSDAAKPVSTAQATRFAAVEGNVSTLTAALAAKVQNSMTASATAAPTVNAVQAVIDAKVANDTADSTTVAASKTAMKAYVAAAVASATLPTNPTLPGVVTQGGATVATAAPMAALAIDVTQSRNTKSVAGASTFTFSATPADGTWFGLQLTTTVAGLMTIPSCVSATTQAAVTSFYAPVGTTWITFLRSGSTTYVFGETQPLPFGARQLVFSDFEDSGAGGLAPFTLTALAGGALAAGAPLSALDGRSGVVAVTHAAAASSGAYARAGLRRLRVGDFLVASFYADPSYVPAGTAATNVGGRFGFSDVLTAAEPANGVWLHKAGNVVSGRVKGSTESVDATTGSTYTIAAAGWYHAVIRILSRTSVQFALYNDAGSVWTATLTTAGIPDQVSCESYPVGGLWCGATAPSAAGTLGAMDYLGYGSTAALVGRPF